MEKKLSFLQGISLSLSLMLCVITLQGLYNFETNNLIVFGLWLIFTVVAFPVEMKSVLSQKRFIVLFFFLLYKYICLRFNNIFSVSVNNMVAYMCMLSPVLMYEIISKMNRRIRIVFLLTIMIVLILNVFLSFSYLEYTSAISLRGGNEIGDEYYIVKIAFNMCYAVTILFPVLIDIAKKRNGRNYRNKWMNFVLVIFSIGFFTYILKSQFMTALILSVGGSLFALFYERGKVFRFVFLMIVSFVIGILLMPIIINTFDSNGDYEFITSRLEEVFEITEGRTHNATDFSDRQDRSLMSLETFRDNPIFGIGYKLDPHKHYQEQGIGYHAAWADSLAEYGLFALFLFYFLYDSLRRQSEKTDSVLPIIMVIVLGLLNPLFYFPQMVTAFLLIPLLYQYLLLDFQKNKK